MSWFNRIFNSDEDNLKVFYVVLDHFHEGIGLEYIDHLDRDVPFDVSSEDVDQLLLLAVF